MTAHRTAQHTVVEELEVTGKDLVSRVVELVQDGNARRVTIYTQDGDELLSMPLTHGVVVGGLSTLSAPVLGGLGALAALVTHARLVVTRERDAEAAQAAKDHLSEQLQAFDAR